MNIPRDQHTRAETIVEIPDEATHVRVELARHHPNDRTLWPKNTHFGTWSIEQWNDEANDWELLGHSTTHGGSAFHDGVEQESSWDETPLRTYRVEINFIHADPHPEDPGEARVFYMASDQDLQNHLVKWERERGIKPSKVTRLKGRKVQVTLVALTRPLDTHVTVTPLTLD